jgi:hypothetical protein
MERLFHFLVSHVEIIYAFEGSIQRESRRVWSNNKTRYLYEGVVMGVLMSLVEVTILYGAFNISPP